MDTRTNAVTAIDRAIDLRQSRAQTARNAVAAVMAHYGIGRIAYAYPGTADYPLVAHLMDVERLADDLDAIPNNRVEFQPARATTWASIVDALWAVRRTITATADAATVAA